MQIFDEILKQYMQLALKNNIYKTNLQNFNFSHNLIQIKNDDTNKGYIKNFDVSTKTSFDSLPFDNGNSVDIKNFYDKMEFDARRYNRSFDSQIGATIL